MIILLFYLITQLSEFCSSKGALIYELHFLDGFKIFSNIRTIYLLRFCNIFTFCSGTTFWLGSRRATRRRPRRFDLPRSDISDSETFARGKRVEHGWTQSAFFWASCRLEGRCSFRRTCRTSLPPEMARALAEDFPIWCTGYFQGRSCPQSPNERPNRPRNLLETQYSAFESMGRQLLGEERK